MRKQTILPWPLWAVLALGMIVLLLRSGEVRADSYTAQADNDPGNRITLNTEPCQLGGWFKEWKSGKWLYQGKVSDLCWRLQKNPATGRIYAAIVDSDGQSSEIPLERFKKDIGT